MASRAANHIHKYRKVNLTRDPKKKPYFVYKCQMPTCSHYVQVKLSLGKLSICNRCDSPFIINKETLRETEERATTLPHCVDCTERRNDKTEILTDINDFISQKI